MVAWCQHNFPRFIFEEHKQVKFTTFKLCCAVFGVLMMKFLALLVEGCVLKCDKMQ